MANKNLFVIFILAFSSILYGQSLETLEQKVDDAFESRQYLNAIKLSRKIQTICAKQDKWEEYIKRQLDIGHCYYLDAQFVKMPLHLDTALQLSKEYGFNEKSEVFGLIANYYGWYYNQINDIDKAKGWQEKELENAIHLSENSKRYDLKELGKSYQNLGTAYDKIGDHTKALEYFQKAREYFSPDSHDVAINFNNVGWSLAYQKNYKECILYYKRAERILKKLKEDEDIRNSKLFLYLNLAHTYKDQQKFDSAYFYLEKYRELIRSGEKVELAIYHQVMSKTHMMKGLFKKSELELNQTIAIQEKLYEEKNINKANSYQDMGELCTALGRHEAALNYYQKAFVNNGLDYIPTSDTSNFTLANSFKNNLLVLTTLKYKAKSLIALNQLQAAKSTLDLAIQLIDQIRFNYLAEGSKYALLERAIPVYEQAIGLALEMEDEAYAFELAERGKATVLLENIKNSEAKAFAGISDELMEEEREQKVQIAFYERLLYETESAEEKANYQNQVFELKQAYEMFLADLEVQHPDYYRLKYDIQYPSIKEVQGQLLGRNTALLEYFTGDSSIYAFIVTKDDLKVKQFPKTENFNTQLASMRDAITRPSMEKKDFLAYANSSNQIYATFVDPLLEQLAGSVQELIVIPDGQLSYVPFQALVQHPLANNFEEARYDTLSYLVKDYAINYAYSSTLLLENNKQVSKEGIELAAFAPVFSEQQLFALRRSGLGALPYSEQEVHNISAMLESQTFMNEGALAAVFRSEAPNFNLLHLSTHAAVDDANPSQSKIYFHDDYITVNEVYNLPIQANLTVLSACETGIGEYKRGEGMLSLARAFMYAGCPSLVTSLWQVSDQTTSTLMVDFYQALKEGKHKSNALQTAQLNYLNQVSGSKAAHPFYWAAFVQIGDNQPLIANNSWMYYGIGVGIVLFLAILLVGLQRRRSKA